MDSVPTDREATCRLYEDGHTNRVGDVGRVVQATGVAADELKLRSSNGVYARPLQTYGLAARGVE